MKETRKRKMNDNHTSVSRNFKSLVREVSVVVACGDDACSASRDLQQHDNDQLIEQNAQYLEELLQKVVTKRSLVALINDKSQSSSSSSSSSSPAGGGVEDPSAAVLPQIVKPTTNTSTSKQQSRKEYEKEKNRYKGKNDITDQITPVIPFCHFAPASYDCGDGDDQPVAVRMVELSDIVWAQIHAFVQDVAASYNSVPFHNFQQASHVVQSVRNLLNCIVTPTECTSSTNNGTTHQSPLSTGSSSFQEQLRFQRHQQTYGFSSDPLLHFAVAVAALIHDMGHEGVGNKQLI
jgi:hypothetical protein